MPQLRGRIRALDPAAAAERERRAEAAVVACKGEVLGADGRGAKGGRWMESVLVLLPKDVVWCPCVSYCAVDLFWMVLARARARVRKIVAV